MKNRGWLAILVIAVAVAALVAPFASSWPDGLEKVAGQLGFAPRAAAPAPGYALPGLPEGHVSTGVAGILGTLIVFAAVYGLAALLAARARKRNVQLETHQ
ncbi:MAG TPA: PDGLE domain-containing protein [Armatimonadota bacterium]|jgi:cobalt/nickel transport protein